MSEPTTLSYAYEVRAHHGTITVGISLPEALSVDIELPSSQLDPTHAAIVLRSPCCGDFLSSVGQLTYLYCTACAEDTSYLTGTPTLVRIHGAHETTQAHVTGWFETHGAVLTAPLLAQQLIELAQTLAQVLVEDAGKAMRGYDLTVVEAFLRQAEGALP